jgi:transposase
LNNPLRLVDLDAEEAEYIQKGLLDMIVDELDDDEKASSSSSESGDEEDPNETNIALLDKNSQSIRTEQVNRKFFYE